MRISPADFTTLPPTWAEIFGNANPVEVEIGFGRGSFLLALARARPERNFYGVEYAKRWASRLARLAERDGVANMIAIHADIRCLVQTMFWPESVSAYHLYFPDPWWKRRHQRRRLFQEDFAAALARTLTPGGTIFLASDVQEYFTEILGHFSFLPELVQFPWRRDQVTKRGKLIVTDFERKYRKEGRAIYYAGFRKLPGGGEARPPPKRGTPK
jgi:tRNA (guanine-N7-)-methyltransferase